MIRSGQQLVILVCRSNGISTLAASRGCLPTWQVAASLESKTGAGILSQFRPRGSVARGSMTAAYGGQHRPVAYGALERLTSGGAAHPLRGCSSSSLEMSMAVCGVQVQALRGLSSSKRAKFSSSQSKTKPTLENRYIAPPEDGLTRYPSLDSPQGILRGLDYLGTAVFALSGTVTAGQAGMDLLGCVVVGTITATGGGTVRDLLLGNRPVFWMKETEYLWMCVITTACIFFLWSYLAEHGVRDDMELLNLADAMGIGAFCCIGAQAGVRAGLSKLVCVACGMLTSSFGGVIRDVLCARPPRILFSHAEIYASTAVFGSTLYIMGKAAGFSPVGRILCGFSGGFGLRVLAFTTDIRLPSWSQPPDVVIEELEEEGAAGFEQQAEPTK